VNWFDAFWHRRAGFRLADDYWEPWPLAEIAESAPKETAATETEHGAPFELAEAGERAALIEEGLSPLEACRVIYERNGS